MTDLQERVAAVYDWVASYIETNGWAQGRAFLKRPSRGSDPAACMVGAFVMANRCYEAWVVTDACRLLRIEVGHLGNWNDTPGREVWEVTDLLRTMAKRARAGDLEIAA